MVAMARAVWAGTLGTTTVSMDGSADLKPGEISGSEFLSQWIRDVLGDVLGDGEPSYDLDPNARPEPGFLQKLGRINADPMSLNKTGGFAIRQVPFDQSGPMADLIRQRASQEATT